MKRYPIKRRSFFDEIDDAINDAFSRSVVPRLREMESMKMPHTGMTETEKDVVFTAELPGVKKDDIKIDITGDAIDVSVKSVEEQEKETETEYMYKSRYEGFSSSYAIPVDVDPDNARASYTNGVLIVKVPKVKPAKGRKVEIQ